MWGVQMQFSKRNRAWPCKIGSLSNTSIAAIPGRPRLRPAIKASEATSSARDVLTSKEVGFMYCKSAKVTMPRVASFKRRCKLKMSDWLKNSSLLAALLLMRARLHCPKARPAFQRLCRNWLRVDQFFRNPKCLRFCRVRLGLRQS